MTEYQWGQAEKKTSEDFHWALHAPEVQQHTGKLVAIYDKRVLAVGTDRDALVREAVRKVGCGPEELVVMVVPSLSFDD